ncbi:hypothetical protein ASD37_08650 [Mycobacterium sp. Root135]|uniref:hypothetical protein n=1 Tax=Mycobacterium sp. Root135 TaxID=1736457 RepID=UPI0006FCFF9E|nr:hypothetical protein [Mycobacterium sp. Root135]KQY08020.1 hypothetical protein ASD37_08650 [Mycobacterium sp. Root135]
MISKFLAALVIAAAGLFAGLFAGMAAPASAACAPGLTSIPCTIADNVAAAPAQLAGQSCAEYTAGGKGTGTFSKCGLASVENLAGVGCPPNEDGSNPGDGSCGLVAVPGQFAAGVAGLPSQFATGAGIIATSPVIAGGALAAAPGTLANSLANAPGQFIRAIQNGGSDPES